MMEENEEIKKDALHRTISLLVTVLLILSVALCLYVTVQVLSDGYVNICGFMMFRVVTGSMEPTIPVGALMVTQETDIYSIRPGDIVCFRSQDSQIWGRIVTHRVVRVIPMADGTVMLETKGDANTVADGYLVTRDNLVGKVIWYTGDDSALASIFSFFTNEVGFLACIVIPGLLLLSLILKDCVKNIRAELDEVMREMDEQPAEPEYDWRNDPLCGMTQEEYNEMYERIRAELMEELMQIAEELKKQ